MKHLVFLLIITIYYTALFGQSLPVFPTNDKSTTKTHKSNEGKTKKAVVNNIAKESDSGMVKFLCDADAILFVDGEKKGILKKDIALILNLVKGEYVFKAVSTENNEDIVKWNYTVDKSNLVKLQEIGLQAAITHRLQMQKPINTETSTNLKEDRIGKLIINSSQKMSRVTPPAQWHFTTVTKANISEFYTNCGYDPSNILSDFFSSTGASTTLVSNKNRKNFIGLRHMENGRIIGTCQEFNNENYILTPVKSISNALYFTDSKKNVFHDDELSIIISKILAVKGACKVGIVFYNGNMILENFTSLYNQNPLYISLEDAFYKKGNYDFAQNDVVFYLNEGFSITTSAETINETTKKINLMEE